MGASREKMKRREARSQDTGEKILQEKRSKRKRKIWIAVICVLAVALIVFSIFMNSSFRYRTGVALRVGDHTFTAADMGYFYYTAYYNIMESYGDYASYIVDTSESLKDQMYDEERTWDEYIKEVAAEDIQELCALYDEAMAEGYTLSEELLQEMEDVIASAESMYSLYGYKSVDAYFDAMYGRGMNEEIFRENMEFAYIATNYRQYLKDNYSFTDNELDEKYETDMKDEYASITYRMYYVSAEQVDGEISDEAWADAKEIADLLCAAETEEEFAELVYENSGDRQSTYEDRDVTRHTYFAYTISANYNEWLVDESREPGDTTAIQVDTGYYVLYYIDRSDNDYNYQTIRDIFIEAEADDDGNITDEAMDEAKTTAEEILQEWEDGDATEDSFASLAIMASDDSETAGNGGLIERVTEGSNDREIEDWAYDSSRQAGDVEIVETDEGYHILYYVGEGERYDRALARDELTEETYTNWLEDKLASGYDMEYGSRMRYVGF